MKFCKQGTPGPKVKIHNCCYVDIQICVVGSIQNVVSRRISSFAFQTNTTVPKSKNFQTWTLIKRCQTSNLNKNKSRLFSCSRCESVCETRTRRVLDFDPYLSSDPNKVALATCQCLDRVNIAFCTCEKFGAGRFIETLRRHCTSSQMQILAPFASFRGLDLEKHSQM